MSNIKELYVNEVAPALMKQFNYKSVMQIPKLDKVVINVGCSEAKQRRADNVRRGRGSDVAECARAEVGGS